MKTSYVPMTPGGSYLFNLESPKFRQARRALMNDARHMPYNTWKDFYDRGYRIYMKSDNEMKELTVDGQLSIQEN